MPNVNLIGTSILTADQATGARGLRLQPRPTALPSSTTTRTIRSPKPYGFSQTGGFPVTQNNGSQVVAIDNTIAIGSRLNWEQRLGFARMGSYSYLHADA